MPTGYKHGLARTAEYRVWRHMMQRCYYPADASYGRYGGRGISVCHEWRRSVAQFYADMGPRPTSKHQIDRIDNEKDYEPENCRWATNKQNARNRRSNRPLEFSGRKLTCSEWSELTGIPYVTIKKRIQLGWTIEDALTRPIQIQFRNAKVRAN